MIIQAKLKVGNNFYETGVEIDEESATEQKHEAVTALLFEIMSLIYTDLGLIEEKSFADIVLEK